MKSIKGRRSLIMSKNNSENQNHEEESSQSEFMDSSQNSSFNNTYATTQSSIDDSLTGSSQSQSEQDQLSDASNRNFQSFKPNENLTANMIHFHSNNVHQQNLQIPDQTFFYVLISCSIVVLLAGVIISFKNVNGKNKEVSCDEFLLLKTKYGNQDDALWNHFQGGVESVWNSKPTKPSVIMLLYDEHNDISNLVRDLGDMSQKCMGMFISKLKITDQTYIFMNAYNIIYKFTNSSNFVVLFKGTKKSPLVLTADNFKTAQIQRDYGEAIEVFKLPLLESGVMIVKNFNEVIIFHINKNKF